MSQSGPFIFPFFLLVGAAGPAIAGKEEPDAKIVGKWDGKDGTVNVDLEIKSDGSPTACFTARALPNGKLTKGKGEAWQFKQEDRKVDITIEPSDGGSAATVAWGVAFGKNTIKAKLEESKKR